MSNRPKSLNLNQAPSSTTWRRERLMRISSFADIRAGNRPEDQHSVATENSALEGASLRSYGTLPASRRRFTLKSRPHIQNSNTDGSLTFLSNKPFFKDLSRLSGIERPISAYDAPLTAGPKSGLPVSDMDAKINGVRVWYSSFSSIDWLHDAIKDSLRFTKLRKRKSFRAKLRLLFDKSLGWIIVTVVGFLTAVIAFLVVRSEQWLFDIKEGYCRTDWWRAKRFCCPLLDEIIVQLPDVFNEPGCAAWKPWSEVFRREGTGAIAETVEYLAYTVVAVSGFFCSVYSP